MDVLNTLLYSLHFLLWFKGPDLTITAELTLTDLTLPLPEVASSQI